MAGLFGFFDSSKPGPGVSKDEPKKKSFFLFWELFFRKFGKFILANLLYVLVSLPVVTQGLAQAGLTFVTRNYAREKHVFLPSDFFDTIKKNWKQALVTGILELIIGGLLVFNLVFFAWPATADMSIPGLLYFGVTIFMLVLFCYIRYYLYIQIITFKFTLKQVWKNSLLLAIAGLKQNLIITGSLLLCYALAILLFFAFDWAALAILLLVNVFLFPAFRSFLIQFTVFPVIQRTIIDPYYKDHPGEDLDKRHDLNLEAEPEAVSTEEDNAEAEKPAEEKPEDDGVIFRDMGKEEAPAAVNIPKQYSSDELRRGRRLQRSSSDDRDDDGTI